MTGHNQPRASDQAHAGLPQGPLRPAKRLLPDYNGPLVDGDGVVLSERYGDVVLTTPWADPGFVLIDLPGGAVTATQIGRRVARYLGDRARGLGLPVPDDLSLGAYHTIEGLTDAAHLTVARWGVPFALFGLDEAQPARLISRKVGHPMRMFFLEADPSVVKMCGLRVIRPGQGDHNPFHRDGWLETLRHGVTLWIPLANCGQGSSLRVFSGSHRWPESDVRRMPEGARIGKRKYNVPALVELRREVVPEEPLTEVGRALLFSSYLIHGGGENRQPGRTRVSFELRFVKST